MITYSRQLYSRLESLLGQIAVAAQHAIDVDRLRGAGADLVLLPFQDAPGAGVRLAMAKRTRTYSALQPSIVLPKRQPPNPCG
jgi:hypothetical protein